MKTLRVFRASLFSSLMQNKSFVLFYLTADSFR